MYEKTNSFLLCIDLQSFRPDCFSFFFLINTLLLYPSLSPYSQTDGETNTLASRGLVEQFFQLCCCVSFLFWREIGFGFTYYYVLRASYSCGVVLVFLVLVGNDFWCYLRT